MIERLPLATTGEDFQGWSWQNWFRQVYDNLSSLATPKTSATPAYNGDLVIQATSNTSLTFKLKGTDGVVRSGTITLS